MTSRGIRGRRVGIELPDVVRRPLAVLGEDVDLAARHRGLPRVVEHARNLSIRYGWQTPPTQSPPRHECPQVPQFSLSVVKSGVVPVQVPFWHESSACTRCRRCTSFRSARSGWSRARRRVARPRHVALVAAPGTSPDCRRCRCRSGRCRSACTRCRRCTSCRSARSGWSTRPSLGLHVPAAWHWSRRRAHHRIRAGAGAVLARVRLRARVAVVARRAVRPRSGWSRRPSPGCTSPPTWQVAGAGHVTGFAPVQVPFWHVSVCVHALPSLHVVPFGRVRGGAGARAGSHVPSDVALVAAPGT